LSYDSTFAIDFPWFLFFEELQMYSTGIDQVP
jgi:hypothetical protein